MTTSRPKVSYLRVSVTDRCNERCVYCMPAEGIPLRDHADVLRYEEIERVVRAAVSLGVKSVRLTGGEPLVRKGLVDFAHSLARIPGLDDLALTTNGTLLPRLARPLREAGVKRVNISMDTMSPRRYKEMTRTDLFKQAWEGVEAALGAGFDPVKINTVVVRGVNDDEIEDMVLSAKPPLTWRFIELMPLGEGRSWGEDALVPADEIAARLANLAVHNGLPFVEEGSAKPPFGAGPARYFRVGEARIGVISPMTHGFCASCNRLRLTSDGKIHPCLTSPLAVDLAGPLRDGASEAELARLLAEAVGLKPEAHRMAERLPELARRQMSQIGG